MKGPIALIMPRFFALTSYRGTQFSGWQVQPGQQTVQGCIHDALKKILREDVQCMGAGRTDAGVHAGQMYFHFDFEGTLPEDFLKRLNYLLPQDIAIHALYYATDNMHTRFDAVRRSYSYFVHTHKDPFKIDRSFHYPYPIHSLEKLNQCAALMREHKDFQALAKAHGAYKTTFCELFDAKWIEENQGCYRFDISANRFLRGMVRLTVGAHLTIDRGKLSLDDFEKALKTGEYLKINLSVPPQGLFLTEVAYPYSLECIDKVK